MTSYTRDLYKVIARTGTLVEDRWNNFLGPVDLNKYYPGLNLNQFEFLGDQTSFSGPVRLPKLRSDQTLVSTDHVSLGPPNEEEIGQLRLLSLLSRHVTLESEDLATFLTDASRWLQQLIDWFSAPNRFVAFSQFTLSPTTKLQLTEQFTNFIRLFTLQLAQIVVLENLSTEKVMPTGRGKMQQFDVTQKTDTKKKAKVGDNDDFDDDIDNGSNEFIGDFSSFQKDMTGDRSDARDKHNYKNGRGDEYEEISEDAEEEEEEEKQERTEFEQNYFNHIREQLASRLLPFILPELAGETFKSVVEWDKQTVSGIRASFNLVNNMPYTLLHYADAIASVDQLGLCKLFVAPIVKFLTRKRIHMYDPCVFPGADSPRLTTKSLLFTFLTLRAYGLIQFCHRLIDFVKRSPEVANGPLKDLILARSTDVFSSRNWSATSRTFCAIDHGSLLTVQYLIRSGKVRHGVAMDSDGRNVLIAAVSAGKTDIVKYLITELNPPININAKCESGNTALHVAVSQNNLEIARMLLETGGATVDVVNMNGNGATPLHMAAMFGYTDMVELLVDHSASLTARTTTTDSLTPAQLAQRGHHRELAIRFKELTIKQSQTPVSTNVLALVSKSDLFDRMRRNFEFTSRTDRSNCFTSRDQRSTGRGTTKRSA
ncbi:hypothetical protein FGIG_06647 [Fasciola gigantica]|uniref:Uncharacterized protein n=1 Tax=Fasciola gigantica TaxID=46835 RepID=A0A504Z0S1_FASGI|nr:hypothetical protein FGIG_06647 [Fasciola gigantica]